LQKISAVIKIGILLISYTSNDANIREGNIMDKKKIKLVLVMASVVVLAIIIGVFSFNRIKLTNELKQIAVDNGLEEVSIRFQGKVPGYDFQSVCIECSNFDTLNMEQMYRVDKAFDNSGVYVSSFVCKGDRYEVFPSTRSIHKNGEQIHEDYRNSESYKSAKENEGKISSKGSGTVVTDDEELGTCWALAKDVVKSNLKSPSSAKFPFSYGSDGVSITKSGNVYTVRAWVDADNSFGANIRSNFTVTMEKSGYGKNTKFVSKSCVID